MAKLLFLGASVSQRPALRHARGAGHVVVACDADPEAVGFELCDVAEVVDFSDVDGVTAVAARERVDGVLAVCTDRAVIPAATLAERLGLPGIGVAVARAMTHKPTMRARLREGGVPQPQHVVLERGGGTAAAAAVPLPAVLKPADSGGQRGLYLIERRRELGSRLAATLDASRSGEAMLEEYVDGLEVNTLFAVRDGEPRLLTVSDRLRPPGPGFGVGWIHSFPSSLPPDALREVEAVAAEAIRCLGLRNGIAFPQLIVAGERVVLVEVAARIAAGQMADLVRHATGIELFDIAIAQALGDHVPDELVAPRFTRPVAIRFLTASPGLLPTGRVVSIDGLEHVRASPGVLDAGLYFGPGTEIGPLRVDADRRGYVIATAPTAPEALELAVRAAGKLVIETESVAPRPERPPRPARRGRLVATAGVVCAAAAGIAAFAFSGPAKVPGVLVSATHADTTFSPTCRCPRDVAHITFRLLIRGQTVVDVVNASGRRIVALVPQRSLGPGVEHLTWRGLTQSGARAADGRYRPDILFPALHRSFVLPESIALDSDRPRIDRARSLAARTGLVIRYLFGEPARAALLVDGRRVLLTRSASERGTLRWIEPSRRGVYRLALVAIDPAGNRSSRVLGSFRAARRSLPT
jgi:biotin carboxylase